MNWSTSCQNPLTYSWLKKCWHWMIYQLFYNSVKKIWKDSPIWLQTLCALQVIIAANNCHIHQNSLLAILQIIQNEPWTSRCYICSGECKNSSNCTFFLKLTVPQRWKTVLCFEWLKKGHQTTKCFIKKRWKIQNCPKIHHLHDSSDETINPSANNNNKRIRGINPNLKYVIIWYRKY